MTIDHDPLRVCYFGTYRESYTRNRILIDGLRLQGVDVYECHATLWRGIADRVATAGGSWRSVGFVWRVVKAYWQLWRAYRRVPDYDVMVIGYPGQFDAYFGRILTRLRRKPLVLDVLMSLHLVAEERSLTNKSPTTARLLFALEKGGLHRPDLLIMENRAYQRYVSAKYDLPAMRFRYVPHGADNSTYQPQAVPTDSEPFRVVYFGGFLPSHGLDVIIDAAVILRDDPGIVFHLYGAGPEQQRIIDSAENHALSHIKFHGFVDWDVLHTAIAQAHICLGVFGTTPQALMTVQNKVWETLAMRRPLISGDSAAVSEVLQHGRDVWLIPREDGAALADAIRTLRAQPDLREALAKSGHAVYLSGHTPAALGAQFEHILRTVLKS